nr:polyphosphate kinase 1 [Allomuricauda sp.]
MSKRPLKNRDVNWLYFNERVLLEATDKSTPLLERLKFLAIFSSNLDEYFKVRISRLRQLKSVDKSLRKKLVSKPNKTLKFILSKVDEQQEMFGKIIQDVLLSLKKEGVHLKSLDELSEEQKATLPELFETIAKDCTVLNSIDSTKLKDGKIYLILQTSETEFVTVYVPTDKHPRFIKLPSNEDHHYLFLEDLIHANLNTILPNMEVIGCYAIKMSRDAELYLEDELMDNELVEIIYKSLSKRSSGQPTRLLYNKLMPEALRESIQSKLNLSEVDMMPGGKHHNLSDFFSFPNPLENKSLSYPTLPALDHAILSKTENLFEEIRKKDQLVHFPYQKFDMVEKFVLNAANDPSVTTIKMSLYRIAKTSELSNALLKALKNGKKVTLFVEAQARFDEENNIKWGRIFEENGAKVFFSVPNIKVHSKILMVEREKDSKIQRFAFIGTGNFNSKTAKLYCDHGLFTANKKITGDLAQVFAVLEKKIIVPKLKRLLVSPFNTRITFLDLIENEIENAKAGIPSGIMLKMNSLEDSKMIKALYKAAEAGVEVRLLVRGFCCLVPKPKDELGSTEKPIYITSIVDRYLEHGRIYWFSNGGDEKMFMGSADWMTRNLDHRIEVLVPILDEDVFSELKDILQIQLNDNVKARILDATDTNRKVVREPKEKSVRSQYAIYDYLKTKLDENR